MKVFEKALGFRGLIFCMLCFCSCSLLQPVMDPQKTSPDNQKRKAASVSEAEYFLHTIKWPGENLTRISLWYTGTVNNWTRLLDFNSSINPKRIDLGDTILIPENLLITRTPMPEDFHGKDQKKTKPSLDPLPEVSFSTGNNQLFDPGNIEIQEEELFGPGDIDTQPEEFFGPSDIETQIEELTPQEEDALSMPLETID